MNNKGEMLAAILDKFRDCYFFLHNTKDPDIVEKIMNEGFIFERQLSHSTDIINPAEPVEINYFLLLRKEYGNYTVIIAIPKITYDNYSGIANSTNVSIEDIMSITKPYCGDNDELVYTVSPKHVLGYFDDSTSEFFRNKNWDPFFNNYPGSQPGDNF
jgi:hypothetical protein